MNIFEYYISETLPDNIPDELDKAGAKGWELVQIVPMQRLVPKLTPQGMQNVPEYKIQIYFKRLKIKT
jgi:hypothetical protein